jgi:Tat protein secretion system quality control protein TatD with DNase activity
MAKKYNLPIIIHNREAKNDTLETLIKHDCKNFIMHCFSENLDFANRCLSFSPSAKISFS